MRSLEQKKKKKREEKKKKGTRKISFQLLPLLFFPFAYRGSEENSYFPFMSLS